MPRKPRKSKRRNPTSDGLAEHDRQFLFYRWSLGPWRRGSEMPEEMARELWEQHKARLMEVWLDPKIYDGSKFFSPGGPFTRPDAWWWFEANYEYLGILPYHQRAWLLKHPEHLAPIEKRLLEEKKNAKKTDR